MKTKPPISHKCLSEDSFIFCDDKREIEVYNDVDEEVVEYLFNIAKHEGYEVRFILKDILCPCCHKPLHRNGCDDKYWNKSFYVKTQNYYHKKCKSSKRTDLYKYKQKYCNYTFKMRFNGLNSHIISYKSYHAKKEEIYFYYKEYIPISTIYYHEESVFNLYCESLNSLQEEQIKKLRIKPSGIYCYDEQYVFVNKVLYMRMTIIDAVTKLIIGEALVKDENFNNDTIYDFLKEKLDKLPLEVIVTDGRQGYTNIIEAAGAIHHRCFFHIMQNLMTPLQRRINHLERTNQKNQEQIKENDKTITEINKKYKGISGRTRKDDKPRIKNNNKKSKLEQENKKLNKEIKKHNNELKEYKKDLERIQNIWKSKTQKEARRRINTLYNERKHHKPIINKFIKKIKKNTEILINHIENHDIPATNNIVENYYRTTLPKKHKRIYRTVKGLQKRIKLEQLKWTHRIILKQDTNLNHQTKYNNLNYLIPTPQQIYEIQT